MDFFLQPKSSIFSFLNSPNLFLENEYYFKRKKEKSWVSLWAMKTFPNHKESTASVPSPSHLPLHFPNLKQGHMGKSRNEVSLCPRVFSVGSLNKGVALTAVKGPYPPPSPIPAWTNSPQSPGLGKTFPPWRFGTWYLVQVFPSPFLCQRRPLKASWQLAPRPA